MFVITSLNTSQLFLFALFAQPSVARFKEKIPEMEKSLTLVTFLKQQMENDETVVTRYSLADTIFAKAEVECNGTVNLWLGANVMLEYSYEEAIELLTTKLAKAQQDLKDVSLRSKCWFWRKLDLSCCVEMFAKLSLGSQ